QDPLLTLNALLDLNAAQTLSETNPARGQEPDTKLETGNTRRSPSVYGDAGVHNLRAALHIGNLKAPSRATRGPDSRSPSGQTDEAVVRVPSQGGPQLARDYPAEDDDVARA